jgi:transposase InsO family protein
MIYPLVREMAATGARIRVPVAVACRVLGFSTQGYYKWLKEPVSRRDRDDAEVINKLVEINEDDPTLGYRFLTDELELDGIKCSENRVHRLCSLAGIYASHAKKKGKAGKPGPPAHDDLLATVDEHGRIRHSFTAKAPNKVWLTDITEHSTREGKLHLCSVKDAFSNRIVGHSIDIRMKSSLAAAAIRNAIALRSPEATICHSDRGSQFRSRKVVRLLKSSGLQGSMGRVGSAGDNASMESFYSLLQKNVLNTRTWETREELRHAIVYWIEVKYNRRRRQPASGNSPRSNMKWFTSPPWRAGKH